MEHNTYTIRTDGGSRGNPGPAATGYVIDGPGLERIEHGEYIGVTTNNVAEYRAVIQGLAKLLDVLGATTARVAVVQVLADSELLVRQMNGHYRVKNKGLVPLFAELSYACKQFRAVSFTHVRREQNQAADRMVNKALDAQAHARGVVY